MEPASLTAAEFALYPPQARALAVQNLPLLQTLPLVLAAVLARDLAGYDWHFPAERMALERQLTFLRQTPPAARERLLKPLSDVTLSAQLRASDWIRQPGAFLEELSAWMWTSGQTERFREATDLYSAAVDRAAPQQPAVPQRLGIVLAGNGSGDVSLPLFRKLRPHGVYFTRVTHNGGEAAVFAEVERRSTGVSAASFRHWYIDGGDAAPFPSTSADQPGITTVSYAGLEGARAQLLQRIHAILERGDAGPEQLRSELARMSPAQVGLPETGSDATLNRFKLSLLTEGSGTQIFATTFVQWAARECVRRAQPETLLVRYAPRQQAQTLNAMLSGEPAKGPDLPGSLIDADMGAFYTWLAMRRMPGSESLRFLAWHRGGAQAVAIGPGLPQGTTSDSPMSIPKILGLL